MIGSAETTVLLLLATVFLAIVLAAGYSRQRDPLHPVVFLAPMFFLGLVVEPALRLLHPDIELYFPGYDGLGLALAVQYLGMGAFFLGIVTFHTPRWIGYERHSLIQRSMTNAQHAQLRSLAWVIGAFVLVSYWSGIFNAGGFFEAYSRHKGGGRSLSGYMGEANNLGVAALVIYAIGCQARSIRGSDVVAAFVLISPLLLQGTFGGRRGPLFLSLASLFASYWIARGRLPRLWVIVTGFIVMVVALLFIQSQRRSVYLGSDEGISWERFRATLVGEELSSGDNFITSSGSAIALVKTGEFHYARRFAITFLVRPIPRQFWPNKYDDATAWLYGSGISYQSVANREHNWDAILGWSPPRGYAVNTAVDLFAEFSWGFVLALFALGRFIAYCWWKFRSVGGIWFVNYVAVAALSIYLPTQSFRAFAFRLVYISILTAVLWRLYFGRIALDRPTAPRGRFRERVPPRGRENEASPGWRQT